jgi:aminoglycoside 6'-N-acetyltransferase
VLNKLKTHNVTLLSGDLVLRPMTEDDWEILHKWNSDPEVLYYADGNADGYSMEMVKRIYRGVCKNAFCFIMEFKGRPIGECYLQKMNLERILEKMPGKDLRRIDIMIGEKEFWGKGIGTEAVRLLVEFGFEKQNAEAIFGCGVGNYNVRSMKTFEKLGFEVHSEIEQKSKGGRRAFDMILTEEMYQHKSLLTYPRPDQSVS